jgi:hypothetical protein
MADRSCPVTDRLPDSCATTIEYRSQKYEDRTHLVWEESLQHGQLVAWIQGNP